MAGRNQKANFDFFRMDTGFFSNKKIKALRRQFGSIGVLTYLYILTYAYGNDGYYIRIDSVEEFAYDIAESIANSNLTQVASVATDCINYLASRGEINKHLLDKGVISGESIQRQYIEMCKAAKRRVEIKKEYRLVDTLEYPMEKSLISSEEIGINSEEIPKNSEEMRQNKNKIKENNNPPIARAREEEFRTVFDAFVEEFDILVDTCDSRVGELDYAKLRDIYSKSSKCLNSEKYGKWMKTLSWIVKSYPKIINGNYIDDAPPRKKDGTIDILKNMWLDAKKEEG